MVGQSAGAHLSTQYVLRAAEALRYQDEGGRLSGLPAPPCGDQGLALPAALVAISGVYLLRSSLLPFKRRGMTDAMIKGIFGGSDDASLDSSSPLCVLEGLAGRTGRKGPGAISEQFTSSPDGSEEARAPVASRDGTLGTDGFPLLPESVLDTPAGPSAATTPTSSRRAEWGPTLSEAAAEEAAIDAIAPRSPGSSSLLDAARRAVLFVLLHGEQDTVADQAEARLLHRELVSGGWRSVMGLYRGATHTSPIIEDAMRGHDYLLEDVFAVCRHVETRSPVRATAIDAGPLSLSQDIPSVEATAGAGRQPARKPGTIQEGSVVAAAPGRPVFGGDLEVLPRLAPDSFIDTAKEWNPF